MPWLRVHQAVPETDHEEIKTQLKETRGHLVTSSFMVRASLSPAQAWNPVQCPSPGAPSPGGLCPQRLHLLNLLRKLYPRTGGTASPGTWLEMQTPGPHPRPADSEPASAQGAQGSGALLWAAPTLLR